MDLTNAGMRAAKLWYLVYFAALSCLFPFLNLSFRRLGLSERSIGILGAVRPFISLPAGSLWSGAADKSRRHRAVLLLTLCASVLARLSLAAVGRLGFAPLLAMVALTEFFAAPVTIIADAAVMAACAERGDYGRQRLWGAVGWGAFAAVSGSAISHAGVGAAFAGHAVLAALALAPTLRLPFGPLHARLARQAGGAEAERSGSAEKEQQEQQARQEQRATGEEAAAGSADATGTPPKPPGGGRKAAVQRFDSAFIEKEALLAGGAAAQQEGSGPGSATAAAADGGTTEQPAGGQPAVRYWRGLAQLLGDPEAAIFMAMATTMGFGVGNIEGYLFLFLDELGGSELLMGLSLTVTCAAESLVFFFLPRLLRAGTRRCMHLVFAAFMVRMGCYAALKHAPTPWMVLPAEVLHGFTFALAWGAGCAYCEQLAPPGLEATTQGLFQGLYFGLGQGIGALCGGYVYQRHGAQAVYLAACGVLLVGWALCSLAQLAVVCLALEERSRARYLQVAGSDLEMNESARSEAIKA